jgi:hypothetical protein
MPKSTKSKKTQNWFSRLFSGNTKNNVPLSKKKDIAKKWCKKQKYRGSPPGRCDVHQDLCVCEDDGSFPPINNRFKWKFGFNSIKYNKSAKCNKKWGHGRRCGGNVQPTINYKKMKV